MLIKFDVRSVWNSPMFWLFVAFTAVMLFGADPAQAADASAGGGAGLPWESPLDKVRRSISGPVAFTISLLGLIACGSALIWGGEIGEFTRRIIYVVLVICLLVFANSVLTTLFAGALVPAGGLFPDSQALTQFGTVAVR